MTTAPQIRLLAGFDDPAITASRWEALLRTGDTDTVFLTWHWQRAWWESFGRGKLLLIAAEREGSLVALAPLFADAGMVFFVGSGGSDYLDFIGDTSDPDVLDAMLSAAQAHTPDFVGFRFYHVLDASRTGDYLQQAAIRLGLRCFDEGDLPAPAMDLSGCRQTAMAATEKKSLVRHEKRFLREGPLTVDHLSCGADILPYLERFFAQHIDRWAETPYPSLFLDPAQRAFYACLTRTAACTGWLRFTIVQWHARIVAFHFGFCYQGSYLWYKPTFDIHLASRSPGEVLLRQLLLSAIDEEAHTFDFGLGDEAFKSRFATTVSHVRTWGLYPS